MSVASETLTRVTQLKIGNVCLFVYVFGHTYVILYFDPPYFCVRSTFDPAPNFTKQNPLGNSQVKLVVGATHNPSLHFPLLSKVHKRKVAVKTEKIEKVGPVAITTRVMSLRSTA